MTDGHDGFDYDDFDPTEPQQPKTDPSPRYPDPSPLAKAAQEAYKKSVDNGPCGCGYKYYDTWDDTATYFLCPSCAEEIAQAVIGAYKRWVVTQVKEKP